MRTLLQDIRYAARMMAQRPGFTAIAVVTLAVCIAANAAIFGVVNAVLIAPLPFSAPDRLYAVWGVNTTRNETQGAASYLDYVDFKTRNTTFEGMAGFGPGTGTLTCDGEAEHVAVAEGSANLFHVLGVKPMMGRDFLESEDQPGSAATFPVILSESLWRGRFHGDPEIVGKSLELDGRSVTVVGVMPASFRFPLQFESPSLWKTMATEMTSADGSPGMAQQRGAHFMELIGRLKTGVTPAEAQANLSTIAANLASQYPATDVHHGIRIEPEIARLTGTARPALILVLVAVTFVLLIGCANIANLLLARASTRQKEMALRVSLGASPGRIARQLLTESLLLGLLSGAVGLFLAWLATSAVVRLGPKGVPRIAEAGIDARVFAFTFAISVLTSVIFGLAPILHFRRGDFAAGLKESGRGVTSNTASARTRSALVVVEVALALMLLVGSGLMIQSLVRLQHASPGFDPHGVVAINIDLADARYPSPQQLGDFWQQTLAKVRALPGVTSASSIFPLPFSGERMRVTFQIEGHPVAEGEEPATHYYVASTDYFQTMRIPLRQGRAFAPTDLLESAPVAIVNQAFAEKFFPGENAVGKHIQPAVSIDNKPARMREIVGVAANTKMQTLREEPQPECYVPATQTPFDGFTLLLRTPLDPARLAPGVKDVVASIDRSAPLYNIKTLDEYVGRSVEQDKFITLMLGIFAGVALLLTLVGLYGVLAYSVAQRTHEIGVRMALGAQEGNVLRLVLAQGLLLTLLGVAAGVVGALATTPLIRAELFGIGSADPVTFLVLAVLLAAVAMAAGWIPARRATRVDPMVALRYE
jgi:putative ABC transport system permease protein